MATPTRAPLLLARIGSPLAVILIASGFGVILYGYNGAASDARVAAQTPYLLSCGAIGIGLIILGAALLIARSMREDAYALGERIEQALLARPVAAEREVVLPAQGRRAGGVIAGASSYHQPECRLADGRGDANMSVAEAEAAGLRPCRVCAPSPAAR